MGGPEVIVLLDGLGRKTKSFVAAFASASMALGLTIKDFLFRRRNENGKFSSIS
jgi:hypothetical protein